MDRVDFNVASFDKAISEKGINISWEEAMLCFCVGENQGQPSFNCKYCNGSGYLYSKPKATIALVSKIGGKQNFEATGSRSVGDAYLTPLSNVIMGFHDRITFTDFKSKYSESVNILFGKSVKLKHPAKSIISAQYRDLIIDPKDILIINNGWNITIFPDLINTYVNDDKKQKGNNFFVSLLYSTAPSYSIVDILHELRGTQVGPSKTFVELSKQYLIKREDISYDQFKNQD